MFLREIIDEEKNYFKNLLNSYNYSYKNLYLIIFKDPYDKNSLKHHLIFYYNQKSINQIKFDKYSGFKNNIIFDLYEVSENNIEDKFIDESQNSLFD
jgi:hypothetical protein